MAKPKILLLSDDLRMNSGIATMSRELVLSTAHKFDWVQLAGAITHPEKGKVFDLSQSVNEQKKIKNAYVKVIPTDGYGNEQSLFQLIAAEKPNAILHFTDPRFWGWLYALEHQIRGQGIPLCYLAIWDDIPYPMYNRPFYESCDAIFGISKQSNNIHTMVLEPKNCIGVYNNFDPLGRPVLSDLYLKKILDDAIEYANGSILDTQTIISSVNDERIVKFKKMFLEKTISLLNGWVDINGDYCSETIIKEQLDIMWSNYNWNFPLVPHKTSEPLIKSDGIKLPSAQSFSPNKYE